jgi:DNA mismatch repair ATPase MutS|nr:MAG TPA: MutS domain I [Caudoviricetes sp.]
MSKLLKQYEELKRHNPNIIYLFRVGIFYNILNDDAKILNEKIGLKITDLGPHIFKCGFPISKVDKYVGLLKKHNLKYKIIDNIPNQNTNDYLNNIEIKKIVKRILDIDFNNITFQQSFNILLDIHQKLKSIYK